MFCAKCGTEVPDGFAFCTKCGSAVPQAPPEVGLQKERTSKVSGWRTTLIVLSLVLLTWAGSFGIAVIVTDWLADDSDIEESIKQLSEDIDLISVTTPILTQQELCEIANSVDGLAFLVADLTEGLEFSYAGETPAQTARTIERGHPIAGAYGC